MAQGSRALGKACVFQVDSGGHGETRTDHGRASIGKRERKLVRCEREIDHLSNERKRVL